jgi:hypothetical protein
MPRFESLVVEFPIFYALERNVLAISQRKQQTTMNYINILTKQAFFTMKPVPKVLNDVL